jgi:hypothetical protein
VKFWSSDTAELELDGVSTIVKLMPSPVPKQEAETAAAWSLSAMRAGGFSPAAHVAHLAVTSSSQVAPVERLLRHTRIVAALTKASNATGVYEGRAHATHDPAFYVDIVTNDPELPLMLWNGLSITKKTGSVELLTLGMSQLDLPDLLLVAPSGGGNQALNFAFDLLGYVISQGSPLPEGETVGRSEDEKLPIAYVPSPLDANTRVMKVELPRSA